MKRFPTRFLISLLAGLAVLSIAPSASADESQLDFRVSPATGSAISEGGDYFVLPLSAGEVATQSVTISNPSSQSLDIRLAAVDAATAQMGGVDYGAEATDPQSTGAWIALEKDRLSLEPGAATEIAFEVTAPADAPSGVHLAGLVIWVEGVESAAVEGAATMNVQARRVIAVQVELPGPAAPLLEIRGAEAEARPDGLYLGIELFNSGSGFAKGTGTVSIEGRDAQESFLVDTIVPRTGTTFPFRWDASSIPSGAYDVSIEVDYGGSIATWQGEVVVGAAVQSDLRGRGVGETTTSRLPNYVLIPGVLILIALIAVLFRRISSGRMPQLLPNASRVRRPQSAPPVAARSFQPQIVKSAPRTPPPPPVLTLPRSEELRRRVPPPPPPPPARLAPPGPRRAA